MAAKKDKRFIIKEQQDLGFGAMYVLADTKTGVNYLATVGVAVSGITPLLDSNGNVVIDSTAQYAAE